MSDRSRQLRSPLLLLLTGSLALAFGQGHWPNGVAVIVGIACIARFFHLARPAIAVPLFIVAHVLVWEWAYAGMVPLPTPARLGMEAGTSTLLALVFLADRWISRRVTSLPTTLALPCGWVAFDLASARLSPGGTWGSIAYSFADVVVVAQLASVVGWTGLTFVAAWLGSAINWVWERRRDEPGQARRGLAWMSAVVVAVFALGVVRVITAPNGQPDAKSVRVACMIAPNTFNDESLDALWAYTRGVERPDSSVALARARIAESMEEHFALVERAADNGAELVIWPEANPVVTDAEESVCTERARDVARSRGIFIGMGMVVFRPDSGEPAMNKFILVDPAGDVAIDFLKATRVPGTQHARGDGLLPALDTDLGRVSSAICFDLDFPHLIAQAGSSGVDLFLAPSNDWLEARATHARMARLRAIEQGFALVRPTKDGVTLITDSTGRTRGVLTLADNQTGTITVEVPAIHRRTVYAAIGDAFAWLCCVVFVVFCGRAAFVTWRRNCTVSVIRLPSIFVMMFVAGFGVGADSHSLALLPFCSLASKEVGNMRHPILRIMPPRTGPSPDAETGTGWCHRDWARSLWRHDGSYPSLLISRTIELRFAIRNTGIGIRQWDIQSDTALKGSAGSVRPCSAPTTGSS